MRAMTNAQNTQHLAAIGVSLLAGMLLVILCPAVVAQDKAPAAAKGRVRTLAIVNKPWTGRLRDAHSAPHDPRAGAL